MNVKLLLDEDVHASLAETLRKRGYDAVHSQELERKGLSDAEQLEYAALQERCFVSFNVKDFVLLHNVYVAEEKEHWGILVSKQRPVGEVLRRLLALLQPFSGEEMKNRLEFL